MNDRIFDVGYRRLADGPRHRFAPWPIARTALVLAWRRRATKIALLFCLGSIILHGGWMVTQVLLRRFDETGLGHAALGEATFGTTQEVLSSFVQVQFVACVVALAIIAAGFVADDRHAGAFDLYFARPLTRLDYALGKSMAAAAVPAAALVLPALALWFIAVGGTNSTQGATLWLLGPPTLATALCGTLWLTGGIIGLSALGEKSRTVGAVFVAVFLGLTSLGDALPMAGHDWVGYASPIRDLRTVADALLDVGTQSMGGALLRRSGSMNESALGSFLALSGQAGLGFGALAWRLRREVVG
jgi:hypothetical protein